MRYLKAVALIFPLLIFGLFAFIVAVPAMLTGQRWKFLNQVFLKPFGIVARAIVGIKQTTINEHLIHSRRPAVLLSNHQSGFDLACVGYICPGATVVVGKKEIGRIPLFGWYWKAAGNLFLDRSNPKNAKAALTEIAKVVHKQNLNVAIFPEGTRNTGKSPGLLPFKKGAFFVARELGVPLIPVVCSNLRGRGIWETFELNGGRIIISVMEPIGISDWTDENLAQKVAGVHALMSAEFERISALAASEEVI